MRKSGHRQTESDSENDPSIAIANAGLASASDSKNKGELKTNNGPSYLKADFDPSSLTVPQLMQILTERNVELPMTKQKKDVYIKLFNDNIAAKRTKILQQIQKSEKVGLSAKKLTAAANSIIDVEALKLKRRKPAFESDFEESSVSSQNKPKANDESEVVEVELNPFQKIDSPLSKALDSKKNKGDLVQGEEDGGNTPKINKRQKSMVSDSLNQLKNVKCNNKLSHTPNAPSPLPFMFRMGHSPPEVRFTDRTEPPQFTSTVESLDVFEVGKNTSANIEIKSRSTTTTARASIRKKSSKNTSPTVTSRVDPKSLLIMKSSSIRDNSEHPHVSFNTPSTPVAPNTPGRFLNLAALSPKIEYSSNTPTTLPPQINIMDEPIPQDLPSKPVVVVGKKTKKPSLPQKKKRFIFDFSFFVSLSFLLLFGLGLHWYTEVKEVLNYCSSDNSSHPSSFAYQGSNPLGKLLPTCIPCPDHAVCVDKTVVSCDSPQLTLMPALLQRLVPSVDWPFFMVRPRCVEDKQRKVQETKKKQRVEHLLTIINEHVRTWVGEAICGGQSQSVLEQFSFVLDKRGNVLGMPMSFMKQDLWSKLSGKWTQQEFDGYWDMVLQRILTEEEKVLLIFDESGQHRLFASIDPPILSMTCSLKKSMWDAMKKYSAELSMTGLAILAALWFWNQRQMSLQESKKVSIMVHDVLDMIHEEADNYRMDSIRHPIPGLAVNQLRDYLLLEILPENVPRLYQGEAIMDASGRTRWLMYDRSMRDRIWKKVRSFVLRNSNIRETSMELKGDTLSVWQWVGSSALSPSRPSRQPFQFVPFESPSDPNSPSQANTSVDTTSRAENPFMVGSDSKMEKKKEFTLLSPFKTFQNLKSSQDQQQQPKSN